MTKKAIDKKDLEILEILKKNSRTPIREIALKTGIKQSTVHQRIGQLVKKGIIQSFTIKTSDAYLDEGMTALVYIAASSPNLKELKKLRSIKDIHEITGEYNYLFKIKTKDVSSYNELLNRIKKDCIVTKLFSTISTGIIKEE
ncbi:MAG: Lrp/AsnC family transcriptional regulator [Candidatus Woesearchaeota archaeon]